MIQVENRPKNCNERAKDVWNRIINFFVKAEPIAKDIIQNYVVPAVHFIEAFKALVENDSQREVPEIAPEKSAELKGYLVASVNEYTGSKASNAKPENQLKASIKKIQDLPPMARAYGYHALACSIVQKQLEKDNTNFSKGEVAAVVAIHFNKYQNETFPGVAETEQPKA